MDYTTLYFCNAVAAVSGAIAMFYVWRVHRREPAVRYWMIGFLLWSAGTLIFSVHLVPVLLKPIGNMLGVASAALLYLGTAQFFGKPPAWRLLSAIYVPAAFGFLYWSMVQDSAAHRVEVYCVCICITALLAARDLWFGSADGKREVFRFVAVCWVGILAATAARGYRTFESYPTFGPAPVDVSTIVWFLVIQASILLLSIGYLLMASQRLQLRLDELAHKDSLTGILNRRAFQSLVESRRYTAGKTASSALLALDLDHFKSINDRFGHAGGDAALRQTTTVIESQLRRGDVFARAGGEEFWLLLPEVEAAEAQGIAERLRATVEAQEMKFEGNAFRVTVSIGLMVVGAARLSSDLGGVLAVADRALYRAKSLGRNRVELA